MMPSPGIHKLTIKQFRSYAKQDIEFDAHTFVVGRNAAGKSNLLDALQFVSEIASEPLTTVLDRRGGIAAVRRRAAGRGAPHEIHLQISARLAGGNASYAVWIKAARDYGFKVDAENCVVELTNGQNHVVRRRDSAFVSTHAGFSPKLSDEALYLPLIGGVEPFDEFVATLGGIRTYAIDPLRMKEPQTPDDGIALRRDGSNAASVVREMRRTEVWPTLLEFLRAAVPQIVDVEAKREGAKLTLQFQQEQTTSESVSFPGFQASDGTLRILGILLALFQRPTPTLVALEEPEVNVHPGALSVLLDAIQYASARTQVVVTTQSPDLLDAEWIQPGDIRVVEWKEGVSQVRELSTGAGDVLRAHLRTPGELLRSGALEAAS